MPCRRKTVLITCEHATNNVPARYKDRIPQGLLKTHNAYDKNALYAARMLSKATGGRLMTGRMTRLLVDLNRKEPASRHVEMDGALIKQHTEWFRQAYNDKSRIHISVHTFTPVRKGVVRKTDIGLLYDPSRKTEKRLCMRLKKGITGYKVRMNYPFKGVSDGLTTYLRKRKKDYAGIELELNQKLSRKQIADIVENMGRVITKASSGSRSEVKDLNRRDGR